MRRDTQPIQRAHRTARSCAVIALALALLAETLGGIAVRAQTPPPPWPYRFVLNGPSTAKPGDLVTYRLDYELLDQTSSQPLTFPLEWTNGAASLVSAQVVDGPAGTQSPEKPNRLNWDFAQPVASGALEVTVQIDAEFNDDFRIYVDLGIDGSESVLTIVSQNPQPSHPQFEWWPYRYIVSGPKSARPGDLVTYRVGYELVDPQSREGNGFVFTWSRDDASFVSSEVVAGPTGTLEYQDGGSAWWGVSRGEDSGAVEVTLQVHPDFTGSLGAGVYVRGTQIVLPIGSRDYTTTEISAPASGAPLDGTGGAQRAMPATALPLLLGVGGATAVALGAALRARVHR